MNYAKDGVPKLPRPRRKAEWMAKSMRRRFVCPACSEEFTTDVDYKAHYKDRHAKGLK